MKKTDVIAKKVSMDLLKNTMSRLPAA